MLLFTTFWDHVCFTPTQRNQAQGTSKSWSKPTGLALAALLCETPTPVCITSRPALLLQSLKRTAHPIRKIHSSKYHFRRLSVSIFQQPLACSSVDIQHWYPLPFNVQVYHQRPPLNGTPLEPGLSGKGEIFTPEKRPARNTHSPGEKQKGQCFLFWEPTPYSPELLRRLLSQSLTTVPNASGGERENGQHHLKTSENCSWQELYRFWARRILLQLLLRIGYLEKTPRPAAAKVDGQSGLNRQPWKRSVDFRHLWLVDSFLNLFFGGSGIVYLDDSRRFQTPLLGNAEGFTPDQPI